MREMKNLRKGKLEKKFSEILLESIDEALLKLGENTKSTIYFHLKTKFAISRHDIPDRVGDFSDALEQIFGVGAPQIEVLIMKCLNERVKMIQEYFLLNINKRQIVVISDSHIFVFTCTFG